MTRKKFYMFSTDTTMGGLSIQDWLNPRVQNLWTWRADHTFVPGKPGSSVGFPDSLGICIRSGGERRAGHQPPAPASARLPFFSPPTSSHLGRISQACLWTPQCSAQSCPPSPLQSRPWATRWCTSVSQSPVRGGGPGSRFQDVWAGSPEVLGAEAGEWTPSGDIPAALWEGCSPKAGPSWLSLRG